MLRRAIEGCGTNGAYRITGRSRMHRRRTLDGWATAGGSWLASDSRYRPANRDRTVHRLMVRTE